MRGRVALSLGNDGNGEERRCKEVRERETDETDHAPLLTRLPLSLQLLSNNIQESELSTSSLPKCPDSSERAPQEEWVSESGGTFPWEGAGGRQSRGGRGWDRARWGGGGEGRREQAGWPSPCPLSWLPPHLPRPQQRSLDGPGVSKACANVKQKLKGRESRKIG